MRNERSAILFNECREQSLRFGQIRTANVGRDGKSTDSNNKIIRSIKHDKINLKLISPEREVPSAAYHDVVTSLQVPVRGSFRQVRASRILGRRERKSDSAVRDRCNQYRHVYE
jgi:hypothetical protein